MIPDQTEFACVFTTFERLAFAPAVVVRDTNPSQ
jgi:hypothetical protein